MVEALLRRCLLLLLRRLRDRNPQRLAWLAPLEDSRLGRVVTAMQDRPEHCFTLPALAEVAGMSRSVFAARFAGALGRPPIEFLKTLRLARAAHLLLATDLPVKSVASRVGYSSRSSFTRAFVACHGVGPMAFRATARERSVPA
jgi:transcriptional regulator GlxA family with amidase domain